MLIVMCLIVTYNPLKDNQGPYIASGVHNNYALLITLIFINFDVAALWYKNQSRGSMMSYKLTSSDTHSVHNVIYRIAGNFCEVNIRYICGAS